MKELIYTKGSTIKLKAIGGANTEVELECVNKDFDFDFGKLSIERMTCHKKGSKYERSTMLEYSEQSISLRGLPSDKNDSVVKFIEDNLYENSGSDFDVSIAGNSKEFTFTVTFPDDAQDDDYSISQQGFVTSMKVPVILEKSLNLEFTFQPTEKPVRS